ncbi:MAG: VOC family protein [Novosphingobium sp.]|nr:VOC family protein [Novosphingobium sp.]
MQQQIALMTLGVADMAASRRFYCDGFGWKAAFEHDGIAFFQMNGFIFGLWDKAQLAEDVQRADLPAPGACALAHNLASRDEVEPLMDRLRAHGGSLVREAGDPAYPGYRGYVADPDGHLWEIGWNPAWPIDREGHVRIPVT